MVEQIGETQALIYAYLSTLKAFSIRGTNLYIHSKNLRGGNPITLDLYAPSNGMSERAVVYCMKFWLRRKLRGLTTQLISVTVEPMAEDTYRAFVEIV